MTKGTYSMGKKSRRRTLVQRCRRCGNRSYNVRKKACSHCGYGKTKTLKRYNWQTKTKSGKTRIRYRK